MNTSIKGTPILNRLSNTAPNGGGGEGYSGNKWQEGENEAKYVDPKLSH